MRYETIQLDISDNLATLTLNRPEKLNAFSMQMLADIRSALKSIEVEKSARALLITGAGRGFCAGLDITAPRPNPHDRDEAMRDFFLPAFAMLREFPFPVVAAVNGPSAGAGMSLALGCDIVVAARSAYFQASFVNIALCPDTGASWHLPQSIGTARAMGVLLLGEKIPASLAADWGMIWKCVDDEQLLAEAKAIAVKLSLGPTKTYRLIKSMVPKGAVNSLTAQIELEVDNQRLVRDSDDGIEARKAFAEKRPPRFKGS